MPAAAPQQEISVDSVARRFGDLFTGYQAFIDLDSSPDMPTALIGQNADCRDVAMITCSLGVVGKNSAKGSHEGIPALLDHLKRAKPEVFETFSPPSMDLTKGELTLWLNKLIHEVHDHVLLPAGRVFVLSALSGQVLVEGNIIPDSWKRHSCRPAKAIYSVRFKGEIGGDDQSNAPIAGYAFIDVDRSYRLGLAVFDSLTHSKYAGVTSSISGFDVFAPPTEDLSGDNSVGVILKENLNNGSIDKSLFALVCGVNRIFHAVVQSSLDNGFIAHAYGLTDDRSKLLDGSFIRATDSKFYDLYRENLPAGSRSLFAEIEVNGRLGEVVCASRLGGLRRSLREHIDKGNFKLGVIQFLGAVAQMEPSHRWFYSPPEFLGMMAKHPVGVSSLVADGVGLTILSDVMGGSVAHFTRTFLKRGDEAATRAFLQKTELAYSKLFLITEQRESWVLPK